MTTAGALALAAVGVGCGNKGADVKPDSTGPATAPAATEWRVGAYFSLSGEDSAFGVDSRDGIELAVDDINKAGGIKKKPMKVLFEDDKSKPEEASNKVLQLIDRDKVVAILGEVASSRSRSGGIIANKKKIPMITPSSTSPDVTRIGPFVFRVCFTDDVQGPTGAEFVINKLGKKKIAILFASDDLYSSGLAKEFRDAAMKMGAEIVIEKKFLKKETNYTTYINEIKDAKPEIIYAPVYYNAMVPIARQAKAVGVKGEMFVGGDGWDAEELLKDAGDEMEGAYFTNHYAPDVPWPNAKAFLAKYEARFKHPPTSVAAQAYDAANLLADAIGRSTSDTPESIREAIAATKDFAGATGNITINAERNAEKAVVIVKIHDKKFTYFATVNGKGTAGAAPATAAPATTAVPAPAEKK